MKSLVGKILAKTTGGSTQNPPVSYASGRYAMPTLGSYTDNEAYLRTYGSTGTIFAIVRLLATSVAAPEWHLYRKPTRDGRVRYTTGDQGSDQRVEVLQHQALNVWNSPNPFFTRGELIETYQSHLELTGEGWWVIQRDSRATFPTGIWPVRPDRITPVPSPEKFLAGYIYTSPSGEQVPLGVEDVIQLKYPNPLDPYRGLGPVQSVLVDIDAMRYGAEWNRSFFVNSATPGGVIQVASNLSDDEFNQMTARWREAHQGVARAHRVAILEGGAQWVERNYSMRDMQFAELRNVSRDVLREAWGLHKAMLGNADDVNRANAETAEEVFGRWQVIPRLERTKAALNTRFLPMFGSTGEGVEFDYENPLRDDRESDNAELTAKSNAYSVLVAAGVDPDAAAEVVGLPPMKTVEKAPVPAQLMPASPDGGQQDQPDPADGDSTDAEADPRAKPANRGRQVINLRTPVNAAAEDHDPATVDLSEMDAQHQQAVDQLVAQYQQQITPDQQQQAIDQIRQSIEAGAIGSLGALVIDYAAAHALIRAAMVTYGHTAAAQAVREAARQGQAIQPVAPTADQLDGLAEAAASLMASELGTAAGREAARLAGGTGDTDADQVVQHVEIFLQGLSTAGRDAHLGGALAAAGNQARHATFVNGPRCELIASEILDNSTCPSCFEVDGNSFGYSDDPAAVAAASAAYPTSGYVHCDGLERCRGALIARYEVQAAPDNHGDGVLSMLHRLVELLDAPDSAHVNGHNLRDSQNAHSVKR